MHAPSKDQTERTATTELGPSKRRVLPMRRGRREVSSVVNAQSEASEGAAEDVVEDDAAEVGETREADAIPRPRMAHR
jgi:hypothetical protein